MQDNQFIRKLLSTANGTVKYNDCDVDITMLYNYYDIHCLNSDFSIDVMNYYSDEDTKMCFEIITNDDYTKYKFGDFNISMSVVDNISTIILKHRKTFDHEIFKYNHNSYSLSDFIIKSKEVFEIVCNQAAYKIVNSTPECENILHEIIDEYIKIMDRRNVKNANH